MARKSPATRRYIRVHLVLTVLYVGCVLLVSLVVPDDARPTTGVILLALLPGMVVMGWIWNMGRLLVDLEDEFLRMLEIRKALVATGLTLAVCSGWGLVELFATVPRLPVFFVFPIWCLGLVVGTLVNYLSHGTGGECAR